MTKPFRSLPTRIVAFVFGSILLTSLTVIGLSVSSIDTFLRDEINQKFPTVLSARDEKLMDWYDQREREVLVFSNSEVLRDNLPQLVDPRDARRGARAREEIEQYMLYVLDGFRQYDALFLLDPSGEVLHWVGTPLDLSETSRKLLSTVGEVRVSEVHPLSDGDFQLVSSPLGPAHDRTPGTLHAAFDVSALREELVSQDPDNDGRIFIVDPAGRIVVSSDETLTGTVYAGPLPGSTERVTVEEYESEGGDRLVAGARRFAQFGWAIVVEEPYGEAFAPVLFAMQDVLLINLAIVLVVGIAAFRIALSIAGPIEALSRAAQRISDGERGVVIPLTDSTDEVGVLSRAFRDMTARLTSNAAELEESHAAVEEANERLRLQNDELQRVNEVLEQLSITDGLTKLHNHRHFQEALLQECKRANRSERPLSLILIDIDHFKHWNDRLGHAGGDEILRRMADVLGELIRETDLLARYGGEEFALIAANTDLEGAALLAEKIRARVATTQFLLDPPSEHEPVTVSIGVATYEGDRVQLFNDADRALYRAKESGRDCVMVATDLDKETA